MIQDTDLEIAEARQRIITTSSISCWTGGWGWTSPPHIEKSNEQKNEKEKQSSRHSPHKPLLFLLILFKQL